MTVGTNLILGYCGIPQLGIPKTLSRLGFHVLTAASMKMTVFWDVAQCSLVEVYRRSRGAYMNFSSPPNTLDLKNQYQTNFRNALSPFSVTRSLQLVLIPSTHAKSVSNRVLMTCVIKEGDTKDPPPIFCIQLIFVPLCVLSLLQIRTFISNIWTAFNTTVPPSVT
jgi:hypothetical protein